MFIILFVATVCVVFATSDDTVVRVSCVAAMAILVIMLSRIRVVKVSKNDPHSSWTHKTEALSIRYICHFAPKDKVPGMPIVEGKFHIRQVSLPFDPDEAYYKRLIEKSFEAWMYEHFKFTYNTNIGGKQFNGTFRPADLVDGGKAEKGAGQGDDDAKSSDS